MKQRPVIHITIAPASIDLVMDDEWYAEARKMQKVHEYGPQLLALLKKTDMTDEAKNLVSEIEGVSHASNID